MVKAILHAIRIKTLVAGIIPVVVGHSVVIASGHQPLWWITLCALAAALCIQIATNFLNDAIDFKKGADTEVRLGPMRVTQAGLISSRNVMLIGFLFLAFALLLGIPLVLQGGWPIIAIGVASLFLAYGYTGGPFPLAYLGLGDLFVVLFFGLLAVTGVYYLHTLTVDNLAVIAGLQTGFLATVLLAINNLRDSETDKIANKRTLAVRLGDSFVRFEIVLLIVAAFLLNLFYHGHPYIYLSYLSLPIALLILLRLFRNDDKSQLNRLLATAAGLQLSFGSLLAIGLAL